MEKKREINLRRYVRGYVVIVFFMNGWLLFRNTRMREGARGTGEQGGGWGQGGGREKGGGCIHG